GAGMMATLASTSPRKSGTQQPPPSKEPAISPSTEPSTSSVTAPPAGANTGALITEHLPQVLQSQPGRPAHARRPAPGTRPTRLQRPDRTSPTPRWPRGAEPGPAAVQPGTSPAPAGRAAPCAACGAELSPPVLPPQPAPPAPLIESAPALRSPRPHCVPQCRFAQYRSSKAPLFPPESSLNRLGACSNSEVLDNGDGHLVPAHVNFLACPVLNVDLESWTSRWSIILSCAPV